MTCQARCRSLYFRFYTSRMVVLMGGIPCKFNASTALAIHWSNIKHCFFVVVRKRTTVKQEGLNTVYVLESRLIIMCRWTENCAIRINCMNHLPKFVFGQCLPSCDTKDSRPSVQVHIAVGKDKIWKASRMRKVSQPTVDLVENKIYSIRNAVTDRRIIKIVLWSHVPVCCIQQKSTW